VKKFEFIFLKWLNLVCLIFLTDGSPPKRYGARGNFPLLFSRRTW